MADIAHDQIFLVLPDGREVVGRALLVNEPINPDEGGEYVIKAEFRVHLPAPMQLCAVLMTVDKPVRERINVGQGVLL